ncbi:MAG: NADH-quinone oxidoreductase subunit NuoF [SAR324 cluster bacterium]|nr:NADH-quinone oxidoreductase subunit NuoF [SAR324 cluster bacterium]
MVEEKQILTKNMRDSKYSGDLKAYKNAGGFKALDTVIRKMKPEQVLELVKASDLRGRGGAGFPTGVKWSFMPKDTGKPSYLICNADESEPGTFKDHLIMMRDPHLFLEGMIIGCYTIDCNTGYIYIRGESQTAIASMEKAIGELYKDKLLGQNVMGSKYSLDLYVHPGAGAYICGEETALLDSLEGKRGQPRIKPPFPAVSGYNSCPTSVNNVETLACLPYIINEGPEAWKAMGTPNNSGTHMVCISGHVEKPGVYEVEMGVSLLEMINDLAGGVRNGKKLKAVIPGGASANILKADEADVPYEFDALIKAGTMMGSAAVIVFDEDTDMVEVASRTIRFFNHESCGQCTPCREGTFWLKNMIRDFLDNAGDEAKMQRVERVSANLIGTTICPFGDATGGPMGTFIGKFPEDFRKHFA